MVGRDERKKLEMIATGTYCGIKKVWRKGRRNSLRWLLGRIGDQVGIVEMMDCVMSCTLLMMNCQDAKTLVRNVGDALYPFGVVVSCRRMMMTWSKVSDDVCLGQRGVLGYRGILIVINDIADECVMNEISRDDDV